MASAKIRFFYNGRVNEVGDAAPDTTVLGYLRDHSGCIGTKEGCAEGDCGACTVVVGELKGDQLQTKTVNACIQFLPTLDGKALFTVENLRQPNGDLHPVQQAMVDRHGSQCGFCTPGFVMSLWNLYQSHPEPANDETVRGAITGNLCRCTGYRPIIEAGLHMYSYPRLDLDEQAIATQLRAIRRDELLEYGTGEARFFAPRTLSEFIALRAHLPKATILAGGTDAGLWRTKQLRDLGDIIYIAEIADLKKIVESDDHIVIGAGVSLANAAQALEGHYPQMHQMWERFASPPIRNAGTLGGNVANGSPIGDSMPALIALGATITLASPTGQRQMALEDLYIGYQQKAMQPNEVLVDIRVPKPAENLYFRNDKVSKRYDSDISAVSAGIAVWFDGNCVTQCRIAFGGMAATPKRAAHAECALVGQPWQESTVQAAMEALARDFTPLTDMRATANYRLTVARNLLHRVYLESRQEGALSAEELSVFT